MKKQKNRIEKAVEGTIATGCECIAIVFIVIGLGVAAILVWLVLKGFGWLL
jgi:hypothetical protein